VRPTSSDRRVCLRRLHRTGRCPTAEIGKVKQRPSLTIGASQKPPLGDLRLAGLPVSLVATYERCEGDTRQLHV
jgi:hypothetical protein